MHFYTYFYWSFIWNQNLMIRTILRTLVIHWRFLLQNSFQVWFEWSKKYWFGSFNHVHLAFIVKELSQSMNPKGWWYNNTKISMKSLFSLHYVQEIWFVDNNKSQWYDLVKDYPITPVIGSKNNSPIRLLLQKTTNHYNKVILRRKLK